MKIGNIIKSIFNMEEKKTCLQIGTIRQLEDGTRQVVVSLRSREAGGELAQLENQIEAANSKLKQLKQISLADSTREIVTSCVMNINGLADLLAKKLYHTKSAFSRDIATKQAKVIVESTFAVDKESGEIRTPDGYNWWPVNSNSHLRKYMDCLELTENGLKLKPEAKEEIRASFVVWAEGEQAEKFIHLCELVKELNDNLQSHDFNYWHGWQYYFYLEDGKGLQMTDNWRLDMLADKKQSERG